MKGKATFLLALLCFVFISFSWADEMTLNVQEFTLKNGMKFLISENHTAPTFSTLIKAKVGSADEKPGITGISHFLEHMMFKGTKIMGTTNYPAEVPLLQKIDEIAAQMREEEAKLLNPLWGGDKNKLEKLRVELRDVQMQEKKYIIKDEMDGIYLKNGGVGLNASTSEDGTQYYVSLPANLLELWAFVESGRLRTPIFREFYSERDVINEERRLSLENQAWRKLSEQFTATAFAVHSYRWPVLGWASDISTVKREDMVEYFKTYYAPNNIIVVIVGDVNFEEVKKLAEKYFSDIPSQTPPPPVLTQEPEQKGIKRVEVEFDANPSLMMGYHIPVVGDPDIFALDVLAGILSRGRTSRLYKNIVEKKRLATDVSCLSEFGRFPALFTFSATPLAPHTTAEVEQAIYEEIEKLKTEPVADEEIQKIKNQLDAGFIRGMRSNMGIAFQLANYEAMTGTWKYILDLRTGRAKVTAEDVMRVAKKYLYKNNLTVATIVKKEA
jgi:predicted Zn-dependent peptidase